MPDTQPIRVPSSSQRVESPPRRRPKPADPCAMVIFGAGGDLTKRLVMPALYNLAHSKVLPENFALIGVGHAAGHCRTVARQPLRHAEDLRRQRRLGIRRRQHRRGGVGAAGGEDDVHLRRFHQARALRQHPRRAGRGGEGAWHEGQRHFLPRCRRSLLRYRRRPARQGQAHPAGRATMAASRRSGAAS